MKERLVVIGSPNCPICHPEREGGGWDGREGSPHKSWCSSSAARRSFAPPRTHPPLAQDDGNLDLSIAPDRFFAQVQRARCESAQDDTNFCFGDFFAAPHCPDDAAFGGSLPIHLLNHARFRRISSRSWIGSKSPGPPRG